MRIKNKFCIVLPLSLFFSVFFFSSFSSAAYRDVSVIRQDCNGYDNCYTSLSAWESARQGDLVSEDRVAVARIEGTWTEPDLSPLVIDGWNTDPDHYVSIETAPEARHDGRWRNDRYRLKVSASRDYTRAVFIRDNNVHLDGIQVEIVNNDYGYSTGIYALDQTEGSEIRLSNNIIKGVFTATGNKGQNGIHLASERSRNFIWNNLVYDVNVNQLDNGIKGMKNYSGLQLYGTNYIYNNTIVNCENLGVYVVKGAFSAKNNLVQKCKKGFSGTFDPVSGFNLSGSGISGDAPGSNSKSDARVIFLDEEKDDYRLSSEDTVAVNAGADLSADEHFAFNSDSSNETRSDWDIGADEAISFESLKSDADPDLVYRVFNGFARSVFGAEKEALVYERFGHDLRIEEDGKWQHYSERSAVIGWETNLPSVSYVEYGETENYGKKTSATERPFYIHVHYLENLTPGVPCHYRMVSEDERGNRIVSEDAVFQPSSSTDVKYIPGNMTGPPYQIKTPGRYILTEDISAKGTAINVTAYGEVVLDLGAHTVTYGDGEAADCPDGNCQGIKWVYIPPENSSVNLKIVNGKIKHGKSRVMETLRCTPRNCIVKCTKGTSGCDCESSTPYCYIDSPYECYECGTASPCYDCSERFNALYMSGTAKTGNIEVAGLTFEYSTPQMWAAVFRYPNNTDYRVHHNVFLDKGAVVTNRHGSANRSMGFKYVLPSSNTQVSHNLIKRARQNGINDAMKVYHNEVYVDSWCTNSFAIQPHSVPGEDGGWIYGNRIFGAGYYVIGVSWAHQNLEVYDNFIHLRGTDVKDTRWWEAWGQHNTLNGLRLTQFSPGGQERKQLRYYNNTIVVKGIRGSELRGTEFYSDNTNEDFQMNGSVVKVEADDDETGAVSAIVAQGYYNKSDTLPLYYRDNRLASNVCNVRFGDSYGVGNRHVFISSVFEKTGQRPDYHTFVFDGGNWSTGHEIINGEFQNGAAIDDVFWKNTAVHSFYSAKWSLNLKTAPGAEVAIYDSKGYREFSGTSDQAGNIEACLTQFQIRPVEWYAGIPTKAVLRKNEHQKIVLTPHRIEVKLSDGRILTEYVTIDSRKEKNINSM